MTNYAVESYNSENGTYHRHDVGSREDMERLMSKLMESDVNSGIYSNYYRINEVSDTDMVEWDKQQKYMPDMDKKDRLFGEWVQVNAASKYLGVTFGRVFHLVTAGQLAVKEVGRNKLVSVHDVVDRKINNPGPGRPTSAKSETE